MIEYPKIETLYDRDVSTFKVMPDNLRMAEFGIIKSWYVTEKVDGTNVRVMWSAENQKLIFGGRTDNAQMPVTLMQHLSDTFKPEMFFEFDTDVILFGEGYGEKIQKGGGNYRKGVGFRLFDILIGKWWMEPDNVHNIADKFNIKTVPVVDVITDLPKSYEDLANIVGLESSVAQEDDGAGLQPEGIVARSIPLLFCRNSMRLMWKLKYRDFQNGKTS